MITPKNILVVRTDRVGDVVLTVPALRAFKQACPDAKVTVWLSPSTRALVDGLSFVDEILVDDKGRGWWGFLLFIFRLRFRKFDLALIYHTKRRTNMACALAGIPCRLGYKNNKYGGLLTHPVEDRRHLGEKHEAQYCLDLLREIGLSPADLTLELARDREAERWADALCAHELKGESFMVIHPGASCPTKLWPTASFAGLIGLLKDSGLRIVLAGGPETVPLARAIILASNSLIVDMTGKTSLAQLASLFRRARAVVSNDSGPVHVAAAVGTPVVSIFLRSQPGINPERWKPLGPRSRVVVPPQGQEIRLDHNSHVVDGAFDAITPEQVLKAVQEILPSVDTPYKAC